MKHFISLLFFTMILISPSLAKENCNKLETMSESVSCLSKDIKVEKDKLNKLFLEIKNRIKNYPEKLKRFNKAQKSWEEYMSDQIEMLYFEQGGYTLQLCQGTEIVIIIKARIKQLERWVTDDVEYHICGSGLNSYFAK